MVNHWRLVTNTGATIDVYMRVWKDTPSCKKYEASCIMLSGKEAFSERVAVAHLVDSLVTALWREYHDVWIEQIVAPRRMTTEEMVSCATGIKRNNPPFYRDPNPDDDCVGFVSIGSGKPATADCDGDGHHMCFQCVRRIDTTR
jgi:hypothetical protein